MQQIVTLVSSERKAGNGKRGPWSFLIVKDAGGNSFQTDFSSPLEGLVASLVGQSVLITYDEKQTPKGYTNNVIQAIEVANGQAPQTAPTATAPAPQQATRGSFNDPDRERRIMRQSGLNAAIAMVAAGVLTDVNDPDVLYLVAERNLKFFEGGSQAVTAPSVFGDPGVSVDTAADHPDEVYQY